MTRQRLTEGEARYLELLKRRRQATAARDDLIAFARYMKPDPVAPEDVDYSLYQVARHHQAIAAALEQVEAGKIRRLIINVPPRHGKSELSSRLFPAWFLGRHPAESLILATYADKLSWDFGREVKGYIEDPLFSHVFPNMAIKTASVDRLETTSSGKVFFVGRGSAITGRGATGLLVDDPLKDRVEADSKITREKLFTWFNQVARTRLHFTIWLDRDHPDQVVGGRPRRPADRPAQSVLLADRGAALEDHRPAGDCRRQGPPRPQGRRGAVAAALPHRIPGGDARRRSARLPEPLPGFSDARIRATSSRPRNCSPTAAAKRRRISDTTRRHDHAVSSRQERDKTCLLIAGLDEDENLWVMPDLVWGRYPTDQIVERMIDLMDLYKPLHWWAERGHISRSIGPFLRKRMLERSTFCSVYEMTPIADKMSRAQSILGRIAMGKVFWPNFAPWWMEGQKELLQFPYGARDDLVDTVALIGLGLSLQQPLRRKKPAPEGIKRGTLGWVKAQARQEEKLRNSRLSGW